MIPFILPISSWAFVGKPGAFQSKIQNDVTAESQLLFSGALLLQHSAGPYPLICNYFGGSGDIDTSIATFYILHLHALWVHFYSHLGFDHILLYCPASYCVIFYSTPDIEWTAFREKWSPDML